MNLGDGLTLMPALSPTVLPCECVLQRVDAEVFASIPRQVGHCRGRSGIEVRSHRRTHLIGRRGKQGLVLAVQLLQAPQRMGGRELHRTAIGTLEPAGPADLEQGAGSLQRVGIGAPLGEADHLPANSGEGNRNPLGCKLNCDA